MHWNKLGLIFSPDNQQSWMVSHASNPTAKYLEDGIFRVYFSSRDNKSRAFIGYVDIDFDNEFDIVSIADKPLVDLGKPGAFDDRGMSVGCITNNNGKEYIYYLGWNLAKDVPFRNSIGVLCREEQDTQFKRLSDGPVMDRCFEDPFSISYPFILIEGKTWKMWYGSHKKWGKTTDDMIHGLKFGKSYDGLSWEKNRSFCIEPDENDFAFSRPYVLMEEGIYKMWYSYRGKKYRIGYAESADGLKWKRKDELNNITVSKAGWDSEMLCYPCIVDYKNNRYMLYNGNGYGKTGFGIAIMQ